MTLDLHGLRRWAATMTALLLLVPIALLLAVSQAAAASTVTMAESMPKAAVGRSYNQSSVPFYDSNSYNTKFTLTSGELPPGLTLDTTGWGQITGGPTETGSWTFTVSVEDTRTVNKGEPNSAEYTIVVGTPVTMETTSIPSGTVGVPYSFQLVASGGDGPYTFSKDLGFLPAGLTLSPGGLISGTPTTAETKNAIYSVSDSNYANAPETTQSYWIAGTGSLPMSIVAAVAPTVTGVAPAVGPTAGGTSVTITGTNLTGATSVSFGGTAAESFEVDSATQITAVTPDHAAGSVDVVVTTAGGSVTSTGGFAFEAPAAPVASAVSTTVAANSSDNEIELELSGGTATSVAISTQAGHGTATADGTSISYTPATGYSGTDSFTYTATNTAGISAPATVSITVSAPTLDFAPAEGALDDGQVDTLYSVTVAVDSGTAPYSYAVTAGALPDGLTLDAQTGTISGTPSATGEFDFTITVTDANGAVGTADYSIAMAPPDTSFTFDPPPGPLPAAMVGEAYEHTVSASGGAAPLIYRLASGALPDGMILNVSTGALTGPLDLSAEPGDYSFTIEVEDANQATQTATYTLSVVARAITVTDKNLTVSPGATPPNVDLTASATGGPFDAAEVLFVEPAHGGTASIVNGEFAQAGGDPPTLGWYLKFTPNPAYSGSVEVGFRLTSDLGSDSGVVTYLLGFDGSEVAADINGLVQGFVQNRQALIASTLAVPGLIERRQMAHAGDPVAARLSPSADGLTAHVSTSLIQLQAADLSRRGVVEMESPLFNLWIDGTFMLQRGEGDEERWSRFGMVSAGADYLLSEKVLIGISLHYDTMSDPTDADGALTGDGWLAGPYASVELGEGVFWDGGLFLGGSSNDIDTALWDGTFETRRWLLDTSIRGRWNLDAVTTLTPRLRAIYLSETVMDYDIENGTGDVLGLDGFTTEQVRLSLGAELARQIQLTDGLILTPRLGLTGGLAGLDGAGAFGQVSGAISLQAPNWSWDIGVLLGLDGDGLASAGARTGLAGQF